MRVETLSRFSSPAQQRDVLDGLAAGTVDLVIGTHRLLSEDVQFKDLGLVVVDEEQRFGVAHKEKLKALLETGTIPAAEKLRAKFPPGLIDMTRLPGLGPKRARRHWSHA